MYKNEDERPGEPAGAADDDEAALLRQALESERDASLRARADFANFRRRSEQERERAAASGRRQALLALLPVLDALERALGVGSEDADFYTGVASTRRLFMDALAGLGAQPIEASGKLFDPSLHEAVGTVVLDDTAPGTVVEQVHRGFTLGADVLRPAQVIVAAVADDVVVPSQERRRTR